MTAREGATLLRVRARFPFRVGDRSDKVEANIDEHRKGAAWALGFVILGPVVAFLAVGTAEGLMESIAGFAGLLVVAAAVAAYRLTMTLTVTSSHLRMKRWGPDLVVARGDIKKVLVVHVSEYSRASSTADDRLALLVDASGRARGKVSQRVWGLDGLERFLQQCGVPVERKDHRPYDLAALRSDVPNSISWMRAHPFSGAVLVVLPATAAFVGLVLLVVGLVWGLE